MILIYLCFLHLVLGEDQCCLSKEVIVGSSTDVYDFKEKAQDIADPRCKDGCVYTKDGQDYCFASGGDSPVECKPKDDTICGERHCSSDEQCTNACPRCITHEGLGICTYKDEDNTICGERHCLSDEHCTEACPRCITHDGLGICTYKDEDDKFCGERHCYTEDHCTEACPRCVTHDGLGICTYKDEGEINYCYSSDTLCKPRYISSFGGFCCLRRVSTIEDVINSLVPSDFYCHSIENSNVTHCPSGFELCHKNYCCPKICPPTEADAAYSLMTSKFSISCTTCDNWCNKGAAFIKEHLCPKLPFVLKWACEFLVNHFSKSACDKFCGKICTKTDPGFTADNPWQIHRDTLISGEQCGPIRQGITNDAACENICRQYHFPRGCPNNVHKTCLGYSRGKLAHYNDQCITFYNFTTSDIKHNDYFDSAWNIFK